MKHLVIALVAIAEPLLVTVSVAHATESRQPNILVLMGDDWSWPHAGFLGDQVVRTPTFDRLARGGVVFERDAARILQRLEDIRELPRVTGRQGRVKSIRSMR